MSATENLKKLNIILPPAPAKGGVYEPCKVFGGNLLYVSGCGCIIDNQPAAGKLGQDYTLEQGQEFARRSMLNVLSVVQAKLGSLDRVKNVVKILVFVASADDFYMQPQVANGASQLLIDVFGAEIGTPTRSAVGMNVLPGNLPVEIEAIFEFE